MSGLFETYVAEDPGLMEFYAAPPKALFENPPQSQPWDPALAEALRAYNVNLGAEKNFSGNEAVVVTGQQPGLFTGPLYAIYKAITAIRLARRIEARFGVAFKPVFWVAGEDHDFDEVRTAHFLTKRHEPMALTYTPESSFNDMPSHSIGIEGSLHGLIDRAADETPGSEYRAEITAFLHRSLDESASLADWTARLMARLFRDTELILFAPHISAARALAKPVLEQEIAHPLESTRLLNDAGRRLAALGFDPQVVKSDSECGFFVEVERRRRKVLFEQGRYVLPEEQSEYSIEEMRALLDTAPDRFSPNVALRCVVQQHLFPAAAYVAGPGEVAYWAQLKPVFAHFGEAMPVVYPRARAVLTTPKLNQLRDKFGFVWTDLDAAPDSLLDRALAHAAPNPARLKLADARGELDARLERLVNELANDAATASSMASKLREQVASEIDRIDRAILRQDEAQVDAVKKQVARLCSTLMPYRKLQERVYTVFSFLFEYGWGLIPRLLDELDIESFEMNEVEL